MNNIILIAIEIIICYIAIILLYKNYKIDGLYIYGIIATIASCIMCLKQIEVLSVNIPIGFGVTMSLIIAGNLITQKKGPEELKTYLSLILITTLVSCCFLNLTGLIESSKYNTYANKSFDNIFKYNLRIYIAFLISTLTSVWLSSKLYYYLKKIQNNIITSNMFTIIIIGLLENIIFVFIAYLFEYELIDIVLCILFRYLIKTLIGIIGTTTIYIGNKIN